MAKITIPNQTSSGTPSSGTSYLWIDSTTKKLVQTDDSGIQHGLLSKNQSTAAQGAIATSEVYLTNSNLLIPSSSWQVGWTCVWHISAVKTGAGVAAPIWTFRQGAAGAVGDTSVLALTSTGIQVATAMDGTLTAVLSCRTSGASGVLAGSGGAGPANFGGGGSGASGSIDLTGKGGQYIGLTVTTGASAAWTINNMTCYMIG